MSIISNKKLLGVFLIMAIGYFAKGTLINSVRPLNRQYTVIDADSVRILRQHGFMGLYVNQYIRRMSRERRIIPWPGKINSGTQNLISRGKKRRNIIVVQIETFDPKIIDYRLGSQYVMPYLHSLKKESVFFEHFFAQWRGGHTSDVELSSLTSLIPLNTHSGFRTADYQRIVPLNKALKGEGYYCVGMHANTGRFFDRTQSYALMGFEGFFDEEAFQGEAAGWYSKDRAFFEQSITILRSLPQPFLAYLITMQSHGPFHNHSMNPEMFDLRGLDRSLRHYILTMHEVDQALSVLMAQLQEYGFLEDTVLLIYGDSAPIFNYPSSDEGSVFDVSPARCHVPLFIVDPDIAPRVEYKVGSHIDIGPTILDLLGIEEPEGWLGSSLLQAGEGKAVLNYGEPYVLINRGNTVIREHNTEDYFKFIDYSTSILDR